MCMHFSPGCVSVAVAPALGGLRGAVLGVEVDERPVLGRQLRRAHQHLIRHQVGCHLAYASAHRLVMTSLRARFVYFLLRNVGSMSTPAVLSSHLPMIKLFSRSF